MKFSFKSVVFSGDLMADGCFFLAVFELGVIPVQIVLHMQLQDNHSFLFKIKVK